MVRLGQNFVADPNLLAAIVRESAVGADDVVLEVGGGTGSLSAMLAPAVARVWVVELDQRLRPALEAATAPHPNVSLVWGDALRVELRALDPAPSAVVSNLPYSIATPLIVRTIAELESVASWTVLVQREIAERIRARPGTRLYGAPSVLVQLACDARLARTVDRAVFRPRPRVDSALLRLDRRGPGADARLAGLVRAAFAHRRKALARSLELSAPPSTRPEMRQAAREALRELGEREDARAEALAPDTFARLAELLARRDVLGDDSPDPAAATR